MHTALDVIDARGEVGASSRMRARATTICGPDDDLRTAAFAAACCDPRVMSAIPASSRWIFWDVDHEAIELGRDANGVLARVLERGCLDDVAWLVRTYGLERIHAFFRDVWAAEVSERTRGFWRAFFEAEDETWAAPVSSRTTPPSSPSRRALSPEISPFEDERLVRRCRQSTQRSFTRPRQEAPPRRARGASAQGGAGSADRA